MLITIFTPTYNRDYTIKRLYNSLLKQTNNQFEWVVVDDGSTDQTSTLLSKWNNDGKINIRVFHQENSGKPAAHNKGVIESKGELFCCVDSDDFLSSDAVDKIIKAWETRSKNDFVGILAYKVNKDGTPLTVMHKDVIETTLRDAYKKHGLKNDTMLVYKTDLLKNILFPILPGEKFIPEGYLYNKIDRIGPLLVLKEPLYYCEYQNDGYSANVARLLFDNYKSYVLHISTRMKEVDNAFDRVLDGIRINAILIGHNDLAQLLHTDYKLLLFITLIPGYVLYRIRYYPLKH